MSDLLSVVQGLSHAPRSCSSRSWVMPIPTTTRTTLAPPLRVCALLVATRPPLSRSPLAAPCWIKTGS
jgi:hypothetical protein